jgi:hypothetical protein
MAEKNFGREEGKKKKTDRHFRPKTLSLALSLLLSLFVSCYLFS